jgi:hypothetical protein
MDDPKSRARKGFSPVVEPTASATVASVQLPCLDAVTLDGFARVVRVDPGSAASWAACSSTEGVFVPTSAASGSKLAEVHDGDTWWARVGQAMYSPEGKHAKCPSMDGP